MAAPARSGCARPSLPRRPTRHSVEWLRKSKVERAVLTVFDTKWHDELIQTSKATARLEDIVQGAQATRLNDLLTAPLPVASLNGRQPLSDVVQSWPHLVNAYDTDTLVSLLRSAFDQRYVIVRKPANQGRMEFQEFGEKMFPGYDPWRSCAVGAPIQEQPDRTYGRWSADIYSTAVGGSQPQLAAVDAILRCPIKGRVRKRYQRVIFPLGSTSAGELCLGGSFDDPMIDLRVPKR